jgi:hypothetical protein
MGGHMYYKEQECILTEPEILEKLKYWQNKLGLDSWEIKFSFKRQSQLGPTEQAHCEWVLPKSSAIVNIVCHEDYDCNPWPQDMETSLVHELLHIKSAAFDDFEEKSLQHAKFEQFIDQMSKILVTMDRGINAGT